jgi:hypothetical protein
MSDHRRWAKPTLIEPPTADATRVAHNPSIDDRRRSRPSWIRAAMAWLIDSLVDGFAGYGEALYLGSDIDRDGGRTRHAAVALPAKPMTPTADGGIRR